MSTFGNSAQTDGMRRSTSSTSGQESSWTGYEWNVPLDELIDCTKCPTWSQTCYGYGKARPKWQKVLTVCLYLALFDIGLALLFRFSTYSDREFYLGLKDQRMIQRGDDGYNLSPVLCSEYHLQVVNGGEEDDISFNSYVFSSALNPNRDLSEYRLTRENLSLPANDVFITYHYLGKSATVTVFACAPDRSIHMYAVRSTSSIVDWEFYKCCGHYSDNFVFRKCNKDGSSPDTQRYSAENGFKGDLFFVLMNDPYEVLPASLESLNVTSVLDRYDYEWAGDYPTDSCEGVSSCSLNLEKDANSIVVELSQFAKTYAILQATCVASVWRYILYFAIIPLGVIFSFILIGAVLCGLQMQVNRLTEEGDRQRSMFNEGTGCSSHTRTRRSRGSSSSSSSLRSPLVRNEIYQSDEGSRDPPPSYDSVAVVTISDSVETEEPPPPYSSVTGRSNDIV